jgi:fatty acid desaturase
MKRLRAELKAAHVFEHRERQGWLKLATMLTLLLVCCVGMAYSPSWTWLLWVPLAALATTTATLIGHEGSHGSFSSSGRSNQLLVYITLPLFAGISGMYWKHKHNGLHHGHPNVVGSDPDIELWPLATSRAEHLRSGPVLRWLQRNMQGWLFWPGSSTLATFMRLPSYVFLAKQLRSRGVTRGWLGDVACLVAHYALWLGLPALVFGFLPVLGFYFGVWALVGLMLTVIFAPAHLGLPLMEDQHKDWRHQLETTRNIRTPAWLAYFYVGLEHQLEHHIFPQIPHQNLARAGTIMRAWCHEQGLPYRDVGYFEALVSVTRFVRDAWDIDPSSSSRTSSAHEPFTENARGFGVRRLPSISPAPHPALKSTSDAQQELTDLVC